MLQEANKPLEKPEGNPSSNVLDGRYQTLFEQVNAAISGILEKITLEDMVNREQEYQAAYVGNYVI